MTGNCQGNSAHMIYFKFIWLHKEGTNHQMKISVFADHTAVKQQAFRSTLHKCFSLAGFEVQHFSGHSFCAERALDLLHYGLSVETIKKLGWWRSNSVYAYLKS